jgi:UDP-glucose 4-epimerase
MSAAGSNVEIRSAPARPGELRDSALDASRAERLLGWSPDVDVRTGLERTYHYIASKETTA